MWFSIGIVIAVINLISSVATLIYLMMNPYLQVVFFIYYPVFFICIGSIGTSIILIRGIQTVIYTLIDSHVISHFDFNFSATIILLDQ
jgi:hypothetical protein